MRSLRVSMLTLLPAGSHLSPGLRSQSSSCFIRFYCLLPKDGLPSPTPSPLSPCLGPGLGNGGPLYIFPGWHFSSWVEWTWCSACIWSCVCLSLFCPAYMVASRCCGLALAIESPSLWCLAFKNLPRFTDGEAAGDTNTGMGLKKKLT